MFCGKVVLSPGDRGGVSTPFFLKELRTQNMIEVDLWRGGLVHFSGSLLPPYISYLSYFNPGGSGMVGGSGPSVPEI